MYKNGHRTQIHFSRVLLLISNADTFTPVEHESGEVPLPQILSLVVSQIIIFIVILSKVSK
jgi:hypothetical protein